MKYWVKLLTVLLLWLLYLNIPQTFSQEIKATTEDGRAVLLNPNGSWRYSEDREASDQEGVDFPQFFKPKSATALLKGKRVKYGLWYDRSKWLPDQDIDNASAEYELTHVEGDRYVVIIPERLQIPLETLRIAAIANAKKAAPDTRVSFEEKRIVNDRKILCLKMDPTIQGIPVSYINYYYSGKDGAVQLMTYTGQNLVEEYRSDMMDLLNGFEVYE
ncbi:hypothetical protein ACFL2E_09675 [Thermodesulfobacteriota bacterium]